MFLRFLKRTVRLVIALYVGALIVAFFVDPEPVPTHPFFARRTGKPLAIAHRGGPELGPESVVDTYRKVSDLGVDMLEMDIHVTSDGELVVAHDRRVDRVTDGSGRIADMTLAELRSLDAAYHWTPDGTTFPRRGQGASIPTVDEMFDAFPDARFVIEMKARNVSRDLCARIRHHHMVDRVAVTTFSDDSLEEFRLQCPQVVTSASSEEVAIFWFLHALRLDDLYSPTPFSVFMVPIDFGRLNVIDERFVESAQLRNLAVQVWTIDRREQMEWLIQLDVDGIMTDRPTDLLALIEGVSTQ